MPLEANGGGGESQGELATVWDALGDIFADLGGAVASVPIIGPILSTPFNNVATRCYYAGNLTRAFRDFYDKAVAVVQALAQGETWHEILDIVFPEWRELQQWIIEAGTVGGEWTLTAFMSHFWNNVFPEVITDGTFETTRLRNIISEPLQWLQGLVPFTYPLYFDLAQFRTWREFLDWLGELGLFPLDPVEIAKRALENILRWIQEHIPDFTTWLMVVGEQILRYALEKEYVTPEIEPPIIE